jgi:hypothetical protein
MRMKRIAIALVSLAVIGVYAQPSWAWFLHRCCGCKYTTYICCRPYNAFTPVCFGNITGLGCCPVALNCCQQPQMNCCQPSWCGPSVCDSGCCDSGACYSHSMPVPGNFTPPPPMPVTGPVSYGWNQPAPYAMVPPYGMQQGVQQTSYYPPYYAPYNPGYYWPTAPAPMPNYWYGR